VWPVQADSLIRWVLTPVYTAPGGTLLGLLIAGDIVNGKTPPCYQAIRVRASPLLIKTGEENDPGVGWFDGDG
jgi:hypothetical protein